MVSALDKAKRALVVVIRALAALYAVHVDVTRESEDVAISKAYRALSRKVHPDKGGDAEDQKKLNASHEDWRAALRGRGVAGRPKAKAKPEAGPSQGASPTVLADQPAQKNFFILSAAVLLTYQGFEGSIQWKRFVLWVRDSVREWRVRYWTATLETNANGMHHAHLMLQFISTGKNRVRKFAFEGLCPNARANDLLGAGFHKGNKWQQSVDRGHFYVYANKIGRGSIGVRSVRSNSLLLCEDRRGQSR